MQKTHSPPKAHPVQYKTPLGTRWEKEKANIPRNTFDLPSDPQQIGPWILGECVGKGASGRVKVARHYETGQMAAVKILPLENVLSSRYSLHTRATKAEKHRNGIDREIIMMKLMDHPNIVRIYDVFEGERDLFLVLEYVNGGELFDYLVNHGRMEPHKALCYFKQIVYGLAYAHAFSVIHRDLKPENILIASLNPPHVKIADWGMAAFAPPEHCLETSCGSPHYASPEIVRGERYSGTSTDIWSCGVILFALMTGRLPFDDKSIRALLLKVKSGKFEIPAYVQHEAADLIRRMLVVDVEKRIKMSDILSHPFLQHSTSGLVCVSPPSISELDRPLRSRALIKQDLLSSLLLICAGSSYDEIVAELLSPPGQGSLIKVLYFLLARHRERTLEEYGMTSLFFNDGQHIKHYTAPPMKDATKTSSEISVESSATISSGQPSHIVHIQASRLAPKAPQRALNPSSANEPDSPASSTNSRMRPASPSGPRTPRPSQTSRSRPVSTPVASRIIETYANAPTLKEQGPGADDGRKTDPLTRRPVRPRTQTVDGLPYSQQRYDPTVALSAPNTPRDAACPGSPMAAPTLPPLAVTVGNDMGAISWLEKPAVEDPSLRRTLDDVERNLGILMGQRKPDQNNIGLGFDEPVKGGGDASMGDTSSVMAVDEEHASPNSRKLRIGNDNTSQETDDFKYNLPNKKTFCLAKDGEHDKENMVCDSPGTQKIASSRGSPNEAPRDRRSVFIEDESYAKIEKAEVEVEVAAAAMRMAANRRTRARRATSQRVSAHTQTANRRHTHTFSEPPNQGMVLPTHSLGVGEVKGWFANLFNWKAQQYVLHSVDNCLATRDEATRVLQSLGCFVVLEDAQGWGVLKCKVDEKHDVSTGLVTMKSVRFRAEFSPILGYTHHTAYPSNGSSNMPSESGDAAPITNAPPVQKRLSTKNAIPFASTVVLVQEKGALSTFKHIHSRLRAEWRGRDALRSPELNGAATPMVGTTPRLR
ncbi:hypothetical protein ACEPAG_8669 [Sanghuangporus baumii]